MFKVQSLDQLRGRDLVSAIGRRGGILRAAARTAGDPYTPSWALVTRGPGRLRRRLVPLTDAFWDDRGVAVPYCRELVAAMPAAQPHDRHDPLTRAELSQLYRHGTGG
jgi:hypothetical protein